MIMDLVYQGYQILYTGFFARIAEFPNVYGMYFYDLDTAGRAGVKPTGHGTQRSFTNLIISPGGSQVCGDAEWDKGRAVCV